MINNRKVSLDQSFAGCLSIKMFSYLILYLTLTLVHLPKYILTFFLNYFFYFTGIIILRILLRLKNEYFNEHLKINSDLGSKAILITGATRGIGLALARYFYRKGFSIIATRLSENEPDHLSELMLDRKHSQEDTNKIFFVDLDVTSESSIANSYQKVEELLNAHKLHLYALINNAGVAYHYKATFSKRAHLVSTVQTNLLGPILMVRQYMPLLAKTQTARIVNVGSITSMYPMAGVCVYSATKAALLQYSNTLALELRPYNVRSVTVIGGKLMKNTSIMKFCEGSKEVYDELTEQEKALFGKEFEEHMKMIKKSESWFERAKKPTSGQQPMQKTKSVKSFLYKLNLKIFNILSGELKDGSQLEHSFVMKSFDNAIRLKKPPLTLYAGNWVYSIITAALSDSFGLAASINFGLLCDKFGLIERSITD